MINIFSLSYQIKDVANKYYLLQLFFILTLHENAGHIFNNN